MTAKETGLCTQKKKKKLLTLEKITKPSAESVEASEFRFTKKIEFIGSKMKALESKQKRMKRVSVMTKNRQS